MKRHSPRKVNATDESLRTKETWSTLDELKKMGFHTYLEFEQHQFREHKSIWINALVSLGCKNRESLDLQYELFGNVFRKYYSDHVELIWEPSLRPPGVTENVERELSKIVQLLAKDRKCHWTRNHHFLCYCDEKPTK